MVAEDARVSPSWARSPAASASGKPPSEPSPPDLAALMAERGWKDADVVDHALSLSSRSLRHVSLIGAPSTLRDLSLAANQLSSLDLSPLAGCEMLETLVLNGNALTAIDLAPLANCVRLEKLWLHNNALRRVDLSPLAACAHLRSLYLDGNSIDAVTVNLAPLESCKLLRSLRLGRNKLAGELDITSILSCASLSMFDVSASVRLVASIHTSSLSAHAATNSLPPALRRKAATVIWRTVTDDDPDAEADDEAEPVSADEADDEDATIWDKTLSATRSSQTPCPDPAADSSPCGLSPLDAAPKPRRAAPSPLDELRALLDVRRTPGSYTALMLGFRGNARFAIEALLAEHAGLNTLCVPTASAAVSPSSLVDAGALKTCHVFLVRPQAESLILGLRAYDASVPIIAIGNAFTSPDAAGRCMRKGATNFLPEPLSTRDALMIKMHAQRRAQRRARSASPHPRKRSPAPSAASSSKEGVHASTPDNSAADPDLAIPTSPITSSESSPPTGVPTTPFSSPFTAEELCARWTSEAKATGRARAPASRQKSAAPVSHPMMPAKLAPPPAKRTIDFDRLRRMERSNSVRSRVEDQYLNMVFSRCGGAARRENFHSIANMCGLPLCVGPILFDAAKSWTARLAAAGERDAIPGRQHFSLARRSSSPAIGRPNSRSPSPHRRSLSSSSLDSELHVTYEQFVCFWRNNLRNRCPEQRLFVTASIANKFARTVPMAVVADLAVNFMTRRCSAEEHAVRGAQSADERAAALAARVVCYELQANSRARMSQGAVMRASLCASLLAAESGIFNGVTASLRIDRLRAIQSAFKEACGSRVGAAEELSLKDLVWFNAERGLLTPRAVEAVFSRHVAGAAGAGTMNVLDFAPMWLAATNVRSPAAASYLFGVLDIDQDGYVNAVDCAHFYSEKCAILEREGYVPVRFACIWQSVLDNLNNGRSVSRTGRSQISLPEVQGMNERDRVTLFQSVLFMNDDMASVDMYRTATTGGDAAAVAVRNAF